MSDPMRLAVVGTGYVGLTTDVALAYLDHKVTCVNKDDGKLSMLRWGREYPIHEVGLAALMKMVGPRLAFTDSVQKAVPGADLIIIAVGTPGMPDGSANTGYVEEGDCVGQNGGDGMECAQ